MENRNVGRLGAIIALLFFSLFWIVEDKENLFVSFLSLLISIISYRSIVKVGLRTYNVFLLLYCSALFTSTFKLSELQTDTSVVDVYYYFVGPLFFSLVLYFFDTRRINDLRQNRGVIDVEKLYVVLITLYLVVKLYIGFKLGWRIDSLKFGNTYLESGSEYVIPGVSGMVAIVQWMLLIFAPYVKRKYVIIALLAIVVLSGILHVKRGDIIRVIMFLIIWFINNQLRTSQFSFKKRTRAIVLIVISFFIFVELGNIRQEARGTGKSNLKTDIGMPNAPVSVAWFYGYVSINFEVVKHYFELSSTGQPRSLLSLVLQMEDTSESRLGYNLNGFNASTFISGFVQDFGEYYFIELIIFGLIIGLIIKYLNKYDFYGGYLFLLSILSMSFFGNYLSSRSIFLGIVISILLFPFLKLKTLKK